MTGNDRNLRSDLWVTAKILLQTCGTNLLFNILYFIFATRKKKQILDIDISRKKIIFLASLIHPSPNYGVCITNECRILLKNQLRMRAITQKHCERSLLPPKSVRSKSRRIKRVSIVAKIVKKYHLGMCNFRKALKSVYCVCIKKRHRLADDHQT